MVTLHFSEKTWIYHFKQVLAVFFAVALAISCLPIVDVEKAFADSDNILLDDVETGWHAVEGVYYYGEQSAYGTNEKNPNFQSDAFEYYGSQLTERQHGIYNALKKLLPGERELQLDIAGVNSVDEARSDVMTAACALFYDYPLYRAWLSLAPGLAVVEEIGTGRYSVVFEDEVMKRGWSSFYHELTVARVEQIVASISESSSRYVRVRALFDVLETEAMYDPIYVFSDNVATWFQQTATGPLVAGYGVCAGFADAFKLLCDAAGVPCIQVGNAGHAWNYVQMEDGQWYAIDTSISIGAFYKSLSKDEMDFSEWVLMGSSNSSYQQNENFHYSELYLDDNGFFEFPNLADTRGYEPPLVIEESVPYPFEVTSNLFFEYGAAAYGYELIDDESCRIVSYKGPLEGTLVIPNSIDGYTVKEIGDDAFAFMSKFSGLVLPEGIEKIGAFAFSHWSGLQGVLRLPDGLEEIGEGSFGYCSRITSIVFPESLRSIGNAAFNSCESLSGDLLLPVELEYLGNNSTFGGCVNLSGMMVIPDKVIFSAVLIEGTPISSFEVSKNSEHYMSYDGIIYTKDARKLIACPKGRVKEVSILDGTEVIGECSFQSCYYLTGDLILPDSVKEIERFAFSAAFLMNDVGRADKVSLPDGVRIGEYALQLLGFKELEVRGKTASVSEDAFNYPVSHFFGEPAVLRARCDDEILTAVVAKDGLDALLSLELAHEYVDGFCVICGAEYVEEPDQGSEGSDDAQAPGDDQGSEGSDDAQAPGDDQGSEGSDDAQAPGDDQGSGGVREPGEEQEPTGAALTTPSPSSPTVRIGSVYNVGAFKYRILSSSSVACIGLTKNVAKATIPANVRIEGALFRVTKIAAKAFKDKKRLVSVTIGKNVTSIGSRAFKGCSKLKKVVLGKNIKTVGAGAFSSCKKLTSIIIKSYKLKKNSIKNIVKKSSIKVIKLKGGGSKKVRIKYQKWIGKKVLIR